MIDAMRETVVFAYDSPEQRAELMRMLGDMPVRNTGLRVVALSVDNEVTRVGLLTEALERFGDHHELRDAMDAVFQCEDVKSFTWEKYESDEC